MANLELLEEIFHRLIEFHERLLVLTQEERGALLNSDLVAIRENTLSKEQLLFDIQKIEKLRIQVLDSLGKDLNMGETTPVRFMDWLEFFPEDHRNKFQTLYGNLTGVIESIQKVQDFNREFTNRSLENIERIKRDLYGLGEEKNSKLYGKKGKKLESPSRGSFLSKSVD